MVQGSSFEDKVLQLSYFLHIGKISSPISFTLLRSSYEYVSFSRLIFVIYTQIFILFLRISWIEVEDEVFDDLKRGKSCEKFMVSLYLFRSCIKPTSFPTFRAILTRQLNYSTYFNPFSSNFTHFSYDINNTILIK